jgi:hypothetical protein
VDGEALQHEFDSATQEVLATLTQVGQTTVRGLFYKGSSRTVQIPADAVAVFATGRAPGFVLTFSSAINDPNAASGTITSLGTTASPASLANLYTDSSATVNAFDVLRGTFAKANWNYELLVVDGSRGVHNPSFTFNVLSATVAALNGTATK